MPKSRSETTRKNIGERNLNQYALTLVVFVSALGLYGKDVVTGGSGCSCWLCGERFNN
jgi:hypothetical protein